jgi:molecular chaperone DnaK (HSP70)
LSESYDKELGSKDLDIIMVKYLADKFNSLPERKGKENVLSNIKAVKRIEKEVVKIKEILSSNKQSSVKIPELLDYVTL